MAISRLQGIAPTALSGTTPTSGAVVQGIAIMHVQGSFTGSVTLERSNDAGSTYVPVANMSLTTPGAASFSEPCAGVLYRLTPNLSAGTPNGSVDGGVGLY